MSSDEVEVRVVTDPSEGPKTFRIQTRTTSRGELAVILMGVDCAERIMCHESVGFDLDEGEFVFKVSADRRVDALFPRIRRMAKLGDGTAGGEGARGTERERALSYMRRQSMFPLIAYQRGGAGRHPHSHRRPTAKLDVCFYTRRPSLPLLPDIYCSSPESGANQPPLSRGKKKKHSCSRLLYIDHLN